MRQRYEHLDGLLEQASTSGMSAEQLFGIPALWKDGTILMEDEKKLRIQVQGSIRQLVSEVKGLVRAMRGRSSHFGLTYDVSA